MVWYQGASFPAIVVKVRAALRVSRTKKLQIANPAHSWCRRCQNSFRLSSYYECQSPTIIQSHFQEYRQWNEKSRLFVNLWLFESESEGAMKGHKNTLRARTSRRGTNHESSFCCQIHKQGSLSPNMDFVFVDGSKRFQIDFKRLLKLGWADGQFSIDRGRVRRLRPHWTTWTNRCRLLKLANTTHYLSTCLSMSTNITWIALILILMEDLRSR